MKRIGLISLLLVAFVAIGFAGVEVKVRSEGEKGSTNLASFVIKWNKGDMKFSVPGQGAFLIKGDKMYMLFEEQKKYFDPAEMAKQMGQTNEENKTLFDEVEAEWDEMIKTMTLTKTGKSKTIAGYEAYQYKMEDKDGKISYGYFSKDPKLVAIYKRMKASVKGKEKNPFYAFLFNFDKYGIVLSAQDEDGKSEFEIVSIKEKNYTASDFSLSGYTAMDMMEMMSMMMGEQGGGQ
jgi:hypothetical protein